MTSRTPQKPSASTTTEPRVGLQSLIPDLLKFGARSYTSQGFGWLTEQGSVDSSEGEHLWLTARMTYIYALGALMETEGSAELAEHGIHSLATTFWDAEHRGWFGQTVNGLPVNSNKEAYQHSFVLLAAATGKMAQIPGSQELLDQAIEVFEAYFWDDKAEMVLESWDRSFKELEDYRGANANMHCVEAFLAVADATGDNVWLGRALAVSDRLINGAARAQGWLLPEHFDAHWEPTLEYNVTDPTHKFRPYGATIGHWFEWSRLVLTLSGALKRNGLVSPEWLVECAQELFSKGVQFWAIDGNPGFVYTVDWQEKPVVSERMHWVVTEAIGAAAVLFEYTQNPMFLDWQWTIEQHLVGVFQTGPGSLRHEVSATLEPSHKVWQGRPDIYHSVQACLIPTVENNSSLGSALQNK